MKTADECLLEVHGDSDFDYYKVKKAMQLYAAQFTPVWIDVKELKKYQGKQTDNLIVLFDTGEKCFYDDEFWPHAIATNIFKLPQPPTK